MLLTTLLLVAAPGFAAQPLEPLPIGDELYGETFTVIADLDGGAYVQLQLGFSNVGPGDGHGACRGSVFGFGGVWTPSKTVDSDEWKFTAKPVPTLTVGACVARIDGGLRFLAPIDGGKIELSLVGPVTRTKPPGHEVRVDAEAFYDMEVIIPWGRAEVSVTRKGKTIRKTGFGYADHSRSAALPNKIARRWVRYRGFDADGARLMLLRFPAEGGAPQGWTWNTAGGKPVSVDKARFGKKGKLFRVETGSGWESRSETPLHRHAPIEEHALSGVLKRIVGNPVTYTHWAKFRAPGVKPSTRPGLLEVTEFE